MDEGAPIVDAVEGETAPTLPLSWRTLSDVARHVYPPSHLRADVEAGEAAAWGAAPTTATLTLFDLFARSTRRKRRRCGDDDGSPTSLESAVAHTRSPSCCSAPLRKAVLAAVTAAHKSIDGSSSSSSKDDCNGICAPSAAVVVAHLCRISRDETCARATTAAPKTAACRGEAWCVDGVCVAEQRTRAHRAVLAGSHSKSTAPTPAPSPCAPSQATAAATLASLQATHTGAVWCPGTPFCGVRVVWVAPRFRRGGVARGLLERARRCVCYGYEVPAAHVAFSEPTLMGSALARHYHMRDDFPVYAYSTVGEEEEAEEGK